MPGFGRSIGSVALYSAHVLDYLRGVPEDRLAPIAAIADRGRYWPGWPAVVLGLIGLAVLAGNITRRASARSAASRETVAPAPWAGGPAPLLRGSDGYLVLLGVAAFVLSLGPALHVAGRRLPVPLPYALLFYVIPGFSGMRAPGRFAILALIALAVLAGRGFDALRRGLRAPAWSLAAIAAVACGFEAHVAPIAMIEYGDEARVPPVYRWLATRPPSGAILELPMPARESEETERDARRMIWSLTHRWPRVDGVSGFSSPAHERFRALMQEFPRRDALEAAAMRGARLVVVRYGDLSPEHAARLARAIASAPRLVEIARFGNDVVYALDAPRPEVTRAAARGLTARIRWAPPAEARRAG
jgi:hypothetical protein